MQAREALMPHSGSRRDGGGRACYRAHATLTNFIPLSWLLVSVKNNIEVGRLAQLVFNSILFLGLRCLLPGNVLIGSLPAPSVTLLFPRDSGITITDFEPALFDHCTIFALSVLFSVTVGEGRNCPTSWVRVECGMREGEGTLTGLSLLHCRSKTFP